MKKKIEALMCMMIIGMLVVPITSGLNPLKNQVITKSIDRHVFIENGIHLTKDRLPLLQKAVTSIDNPDVRHLIQAIIVMLSTKNIVTRTDIQHIMDTLNIRNMGVYTGPIISGGQGEAHSIPGYILEEQLGGYIGPVVVGSWESIGTTRAGLSLSPYSGYHTGYVIGFIGVMTLNMWEHGLLYGMIGISCLIIISSQ